MNDLCPFCPVMAGEGGRLVSNRPITYNHRMNEAIAFDTHRFVKNLMASGFTEKQAESLANEQVHLLNANLATKADILGISLTGTAPVNTSRPGPSRVILRNPLR